jgi:hypothetical protein
VAPAPIVRVLVERDREMLPTMEAMIEKENSQEDGPRWKPA